MCSPLELRLAPRRGRAGQAVETAPQNLNTFFSGAFGRNDWGSYLTRMSELPETCAPGALPIAMLGLALEAAIFL